MVTIPAATCSPSLPASSERRLITASALKELASTPRIIAAA